MWFLESVGSSTLSKGEAGVSLGKPWITISIRWHLSFYMEVYKNKVSSKIYVFMPVLLAVFMMYIVAVSNAQVVCLDSFNLHTRNWFEPGGKSRSVFKQAKT